MGFQLHIYRLAKATPSDFKAHRATASLLKKGFFPAASGRTKGGLNSKLHAVCNGERRPVFYFEGQASDCKGAVILLDTLFDAKELLADREYKTAWLCKALLEKGITPCKQRHKIEIMFDRIKSWRHKLCVMTDAHISVLPQLSFFISINDKES